MTILQVKQAIQKHIIGRTKRINSGEKQYVAVNDFDRKIVNLLDDTRCVHFNLGNIDDFPEDMESIMQSKLNGNKQLSDIKLPFPITLINVTANDQQGTTSSNFLLVETNIIKDIFPNLNVFQYVDENKEVELAPYMVLMCSNLKRGYMESLDYTDSNRLKESLKLLIKILDLQDVSVPDGFIAALLKYNNEVRIWRNLCFEENSSIMVDKHNLNKDASASIKMSLFFLGLLDCKNVIIKNKTYNKTKKVGTRRHLDYSEIYIRVPGNKVIVDEEGNEHKEFPFTEREKFGITSQKRGHFKTFTEDKPLFGKYSGTWWWSPQFQSPKKSYNVLMDK